MKQFLKNNGTFISLLLLCGVVVGLELVVNKQSIFCSPENLTNIIMQITINGILAVGMTFVILTAGIDLSVGSLIAAMGVFYLLTQNRLLDLLVSSMGMGHSAASCLAIGGGVAVVFLLALLIGLANGTFIAKLGIPPFIITLALMSAGRGLALVCSGATGLSEKTHIFSKFSQIYFPLYLSLLLIAVMLILMILYNLLIIKRSKKYDIAINKGKLVSSIFFLGTIFIVMTYISIGNAIQSARTNAALIAEQAAEAQGLDMDAVFAAGEQAATQTITVKAVACADSLPVFIMVLIFVATIASLVLRLTRFGKYIYAIGGNEEATRLSGVSVDRCKMSVYAIMTLLASLAALLTVSRQGGISPAVSGNMAELDCIAAVVIGGTSLSGGSGTVIGSIVGVLIIGVINNGMNLLSIPTDWGYVMRGVVIGLAVYLDTRTKRQKA